jgi:hypothetical protein
MSVDVVKKKRGPKQRFDDPIHEAWRLISRDRYYKRKLKVNGEVK